MPIDRSDNAALVHRLVEEFLNQKKTDIAQLLYAPECCGCTPDGPFRNRGELLSIFGRYAAGFPDFHIDIDYLAADGNRVVMHYTFNGIHTGHWDGLPPTGLTLRSRGVIISRVLRNRIVRQDFLWDSLTPGRQFQNGSTVGRAA
jgi:hypothetical protein